MEDIRETLMQRAFLYEDPDAFKAGVTAALDAIGKAMHPSFGSPGILADAPAAGTMSSPRLELV